MIITNKHGYPDAIVQAVKNDPYDPGKSDITVTGLISPPLQKELQRRHWEEIEEDVSDRVWALMGQAVHQVLERAETVATVETRLYTEEFGWVIGGQYDRLVLSEGKLGDYKFASVWEVINGLNPEREQQMNLLAELAERNGYQINKLEIIHICRDWSLTKASREHDYPQKQCFIIPVRLWSKEERVNFLRKRISLHQAARQVEVPASCTKEERWYQGTKWAVFKRGNKKATKVFTDELEAQVWMLEHKDQAKMYIEKREGEFKRCLNYCNVKKWCPNYQGE